MGSTASVKPKDKNVFKNKFSVCLDKLRNVEHQEDILNMTYKPAGACTAFTNHVVASCHNPANYMLAPYLAFLLVAVYGLEVDIIPEWEEALPCNKHSVLCIAQTPVFFAFLLCGLIQLNDSWHMPTNILELS